MADQQADVVQSTDEGDRRVWVRPELRTMACGDAEAVGAIGDDNIIGTS